MASMAFALVAMTAGAWGSLGTTAVAASSSGGYITIGAAVAKTGSQVFYGGPAMIAAEQAIKDINAKGGVLGKKLRLVWVDSQSTLAGSAQAAEQVIAKGAQVLLVDCDANYGLPATQIAQKHGLVAMNLCAGAPSAGNAKEHPLGFSMGVGTNLEAAAMAGYAYSKLDLKSVYLLQDTSIAYSSTLCNYFDEAWKHLGGTVAGESTFSNSDPSIQAQVSAMLAAQSNYQAIEICSYAPGLETAVREIRAAGITVPLLGSVTWDGTYWLGSSGAGALSNGYYPAFGSIFGDDPNPLVNTVVAAVAHKMGSTPFTSFLLPGYASIQAIVAGIKAAGTTNGKKLAAAMSKFHNLPTIVGPVTYSSKEHIRMLGKVDLRIMQITSGQEKFLQEYAPTYVPNP
jgi:branched-chain amino acid transport system substrate-binding protein